MWMRDVVHPGRVMPPDDRPIGVGGWHILLLGLKPLLRILRRLLLIGLPVLWNGVRRVDVEG